MSLFQSSVLKKHLATQDQDSIASAYEKYSTYFLNPQIQENIRGSKEEQFQEGFLRELFVNILGYTINPNPEYNLTTELKNIKDAKKTDGAVLKDGNALAVIELKGTDTKDLDKVTDQAFNYKNNQPECVYVVTSNFEKLRFYIHNAVQHEEFHLFALTFDQFKLLWLFLQKDNLLRGVPEMVKEESLLEEEKVTKRLYKDYSAFKSDLWQDMCRNNSEADELEFYKKSQKLLDRFLFIFFAEDKGLLPPNSISLIVEQWKKLKELDEYKPLYSRFQKYFGYMNDGFKGENYDIHAYNGGLFKADPLLDDLTISDDVLEKHVLKLTEYDFETEVDTNILGHIFEHSLNDIENVRAQLAGEELDKSKTKRKKDGVFYTPKYITKYIVDNTVGKLCEEKKAEISIDEEEYAKDRKGRRSDTLKRLDEQLKQYRDWLLKLTICDPACGSGAFLNQTLEFLMAEHRYVDELESQLLGYAMVFPDVENHILERNIYGVDINEESVEIARLSLWLRTAKKGRKLTSLSSNIKVGNSLIDDPEVAGELAFNWQEQFPTVFEKGGFNVVIGNPPYLRVQGLKEHYPNLTEYYQKAFQAATGNYDIYALFIEHSYDLINKRGVVSFILPHKFLIADFGIGIRRFLTKRKAVSELIHFGSEMVFHDASTYTCILNLTRTDKASLRFRKISPKDLFDLAKFDSVDYQSLSEDQWQLTGKALSSILGKIESQPLRLKDVFSRFVQGIITGKDAVYCVSGEFEGDKLKIYDEHGDSHLIEIALLKPHLRGQDVNRNVQLRNKEWLIFPYRLEGGKAILYSEEELQKIAPNTLKYLRVYEGTLRGRERGKFDNSEWFQFSRNQAISVLEQPKIITPEVCLGGSMTYDEGNYYHNSKCHTLLLKKDAQYSYLSILPFINSSIFWFYLQQRGNVLRGGYVGVKRKVLESFAIPHFSKVDVDIFTESSLRLIEVNGALQTMIDELLTLLSAKFPIDKPTRNLQNWPELNFQGFLAELKKKKIKLSLEEEAEWLTYFNKKKTEANALQAEIDRIEGQIDQMVYELYGLNEDEIRIVEQVS